MPEKTPTRLEDITYFTEPVKDYVSGLNACKDWNEVLAYTEKWRFIANDAFEAAKKFDKSFTWNDIQRRIKIDEEASKPEMVLAGFIFMPSILIQCSMMKQEFGVPWGVAYIQAKKGGVILEKDGIATMKERG